MLFKAKVVRSNIFLSEYSRKGIFGKKMLEERIRVLQSTHILAVYVYPLKLYSNTYANKIVCGILLYIIIPKGIGMPMEFEFPRK